MLFSFHPLFVFLQKCIPLFSLSLAQSFFIPSPLMLHYCALAGLNAHTLSPPLSLSLSLTRSHERMSAPLLLTPPPPLSVSVTDTLLPRLCPMFFVLSPSKSLSLHLSPSLFLSLVLFSFLFFIPSFIFTSCLTFSVYLASILYPYPFPLSLFKPPSVQQMSAVVLTACVHV